MNLHRYDGDFLQRHFTCNQVSPPEQGYHICVYYQIATSTINHLQSIVIQLPITDSQVFLEEILV